MSAQCPQCGTSIDQDYGVVSCPHCSAMLIVDMDGHVQVGAAESAGAGGGVAQEIFSTQEEPEKNLYSSTESLPEEIFPPAPELNLLEEIQQVSEQPATDSALMYSVVIECIDHAALRNQIRDILSDPKFNWDVKEIMASQTMGRIEIKKINAVKAITLIRSLKSIPVKVSWRQNAYS